MNMLMMLVMMMVNEDDHDDHDANDNDNYLDNLLQHALRGCPCFFSVCLD